MALSTTIARALRSKLAGAVVGADDAGYDERRQVWNGAIDRRPCAIACCLDAGDVQHALRVAREHGVRVTVRGGGHNVAGLALVDGALLVDLSGMREVRVDAARRAAHIGGGASWSDVDAATSAFGLATTGGLISSTGVGGFTLGGGAGWLMRRHGLACDNLLSARLVQADGHLVQVDAATQPDLFWALRGGAGGLGVVTSFELRLHPVDTVRAGLLIFDGAQAAAVLRRFRDVVADAPDECCAMAVMTNAPPLPFLAGEWHGRPVCIVAVCCTGEAGIGERFVDALRQAGTPVADHVGPMPYVEWQRKLDPSAPRGRQQYWKNVNFERLDDAAIDAIARASLRRPTPFTELHVQHMGGAVARVAASETAFTQRGARYFVNLLGAAETASEFDGLRAWIRSLSDQLSVHALPGRMPNFSDGDDPDAALRTGGDHARRLQALRARFDPDGLFANPRHASADGGS